MGFSFAYVSLSSATGALLLFASVQISMIGVAVLRGGHLSVMQWLGLALPPAESPSTALHRSAAR